MIKINNLLNLASGIYYIASPMVKSSIDKATRLMERCLIQGKYVTREEFEVSQARVLKLQQKLDAKLKKPD
jgi:BMFP domain-containing protein YqiC